MSQYNNANFITMDAYEFSVNQFDDCHAADFFYYSHKTDIFSDNTI